MSAGCLCLLPCTADGVWDVRVRGSSGSRHGERGPHIRLVQQTETADGASQFKAVYNDTGAKEGECSSLDPVKS